MSKAALALLNADDEESAPSESASKRAIKLLEGKADLAENKPHEFRFDPSMLDDPDVASGYGAVEAGLHAASATAGTALGGIVGAGEVLKGNGVDAASDASDWWKQALTYQPRTAAGQGAVDVGAGTLGLAAAPLQAVKDFAGDNALEATGSPGFATLMSMAPDTILSLIGAPGVPKGAGASLLEDAATAGRTVRDATAPARDAASRFFARDDIPPSATPESTVNPLSRENLGAAAAVPSQLATASPELQAAVRAEARAGGVDRAALDRHLEADSLPIPMRLTEGQATQDPVQLSNELNRRGKDTEFAARYNQQNQQLIDNLDEIRREASPNVVGNDPVQSGQQLVDLYKSADEAATQQINEAYQALRDAAGGDLPIDGQAFTRNADAALKQNMKTRYLPAEIASDLNDFRSGERAMTFTDFENMRTNLAAAARKADRAGDGNAAAAIGMVRTALEDLPLTGDAAALKPLADQARTLARERFARIKNDPAYKAVVSDETPAGELSPLADKFVEQYVVKGKAAHVTRMRENLGNSADANELIAGGALNYLKQKSGVNMYTNEGNFSQAGYNRALAELTPKLNDLVGPQRAEQVQTLGNVARYTQHQPRGSFVNNSNTFVAAAMEGAKSSIEGAANVAAGGVPVGTWTRKALESRADKKFVRESLKPGAGLKPKDRQ